MNEGKFTGEELAITILFKLSFCNPIPTRLLAPMHCFKITAQKGFDVPKNSFM